MAGGSRSNSGRLREANLSNVSKFDTFCEEVLGRDPWMILKKSVAEDLHGVLAPRIVLGWLRQNLAEDVQVPGTGIRLAKTDETDAKALIRKAAEVCAALDCQPTLVKMSTAQTGRLGKAIDDLLKRRKQVVGKVGTLEKVDLPGKMAAPWAPKAPEKPAPQSKQKGNSPAKPVEPPKLTRSEQVTFTQLQQPCWRCNQPQLVGSELRGCLCTARMLKSEPVFFGARGTSMVLIGDDAVVTEILASLPD